MDTETLKIVSLRVGNASYEIELVRDSLGFSVWSYLKDGEQRIPVSPRYAASYEVHYDYFCQHGEQIQEHLLAIAKSDLAAGLYLRVRSGEAHQPERIRLNQLSVPSSPKA